MEQERQVGRMKKWVWILAALMLCALLGLEIYRSNFRLTEAHIELSLEKITEPVRIVHLSDLHNAEYGENNEDLIGMVSEKQPDLIFFTGDLVTGSKKETDVAMDLVENLAKIAPLYISIGNHEQMHEGNFGSDLTGMLEARSARVMEFTYEDITVKGQQLRIGGISGYCLPDIYLKTGEANLRECQFLWEFQNTDRCKLLLAHMPCCWIRNDGISHWDADTVFSGHVHGGQIELPGIGGIYGPDMGLFPGPLAGAFPSADGKKTLVISRGLGNSLPVPRLGNPPQVLVVDLLSEP